MSIDPSQLDHYLLVDRVAYHDDDVPFVLLWSEKSGCTALLTWFLAHTRHYDEAAAYGLWMHDWEVDVMRRRPGNVDRLRQRILDGAPVYKLVRNPYERVVSSYLTLFEFDDGADHPTIPMRRAVREHTYGHPDVAYSFSIRHYLRWLATLDIDSIDGHHRPQTTALDLRLDELGIPLTYLRLERLDDELRGLESRHGLAHIDPAGLRPPPHHTNRSPIRFADRSAIADLQPAIPLGAGPGMPAMPRPRDFMADDVVADIERLFARDLRMLGYERPDGSTR